MKKTLEQVIARGASTAGVAEEDIRGLLEAAAVSSAGRSSAGAPSAPPPTDERPAERTAERRRKTAAAPDTTARDRAKARRKAKKRIDRDRRTRVLAAFAEMSGFRIDQVKLLARMPPEVRGVAASMMYRDESAGHRKALSVLMMRVPWAQAERIITAEDLARPDWPRLAAACFAQWQLSHPARRGAGCSRIVDGIPTTAYKFVLPARRWGQWGTFHVNTLWGTTGPFRELERRGIYHRRQPPRGTTPYDGIARCSSCRTPWPLGAGQRCGCADGRQIQFSLGQTRYGKAMSGRSAYWAAVHGSAEARAFVERWAPWLLAPREEIETAAACAIESGDFVPRDPVPAELAAELEQLAAELAPRDPSQPDPD